MSLSNTHRSVMHARRQDLAEPVTDAWPMPAMDKEPPRRFDSLDESIRHLAGHWRLLALTTLIGLLAGIAFLFVAPRMYEANLLIKLENLPEQSRNQNSDWAVPYDAKPSTAAEMEVLRSRSTVAHAVDALQLYILAKPDRGFGFLGSLLPGSGPNAGKKLKVSRFNVPEELENSKFILTSKGNGHYELANDEYDIHFTGEAGKAYQHATRAGNMEIAVDRLSAGSGERFVLIREPRLQAIQKLQKALRINELGKQSGVISVSIENRVPELASGILDAIGRAYLSQNLGRRSEEAEKSLAFLESQLPKIKKDLEESEARYNQLRNHQGTINLGEEARSVVQESAAAQSKLIELTQRKEQLLSRFQEAHPQVQSINEEIQLARRAISSMETKIKSMPGVEQDVLRAARDRQVNTELYSNLLANAQQLRLASASKVGNARLVDNAETPVKPSSPNIPLVLALTPFAGLLAGVLLILGKRNIGRSVSDPHQIETESGVSIDATILHRDEKGGVFKRLRPNDGAQKLLPAEEQYEGTIESFRSLRVMVERAMQGSDRNIIMVTGPTAGVGKSFVSANLAAVLSSFGRRVILVDADLRTGHLYRYFQEECGKGLSELLTGRCTLDEAIGKDVLDNLDFLSTGSPHKAVAQLLARNRFADLLQLLATRYDAVLIDTPPVLSVSDALIVGAHADLIYNVVRSDKSTVEQMEETLKRMRKAGLAVTGNIFNDMKLRSFARYQYGSAYY